MHQASETYIKGDKIMEKYDITKPFVLPVGMYKLNDNPSISFQLNRLVNFDLGDLDEIRKVGSQIKDVKSWTKARELFFEYYEDFFKGEHPIVEKLSVPYDGYAMPVLKMNPDVKSKGIIVAHGGFDSSYEEFFPQMMYLRQLGYTVYLFEGPGQGECIRFHNAPLIIEWEKPVKALTEYFDLNDVTLIGESLGGFYAPRVSAFDSRVSRCVSIAQFPSLKQNFTNHGFTSGLIVAMLDVILYGFGWLINLLYKLKKGKGMMFFKTYFHRFGTNNAYKLANILWKIDLGPIADKLSKDYLIIGGSKFYSTVAFIFIRRIFSGSLPGF